MVRGVPSFCPYCGTELSRRRFEARDRHYCESCERFVWRDSSPCGGVAVVDEGAVLLVKRAEEPWRGYWDFPAGFLEVDEEPRAGAARELREETGLEASAADLSLFETAVYERGNDEYVLLVLYAVPRSATSGDVVETEETSAAEFLSPGEFERSGESMIPPVRELFEAVSDRTN